VIRQFRIGNVFLCAFALAACEPGEIALITPGASGGGVERTTLTVRAAVDPVDAALADSLGWQQGVPEAEVHILLHGTAQWMIQYTDSTGTVSFEGLLPGLYRVYAGRVLTEAEAAGVGGLIRALGDGRTLWVGGEAELELALLADRPGSLLISEIGNGGPPSWETGGTSYYANRYFEVYNNSDSTIYLDGVVFGATAIIYKYTRPTPCSMTEPVRTDPEGVYARWMLAFPGRGTDYPIGPGEVRLVAVAAIDHTPVHPALPDLSDADFEIGGAGAANNPAVPDMVDIGLAPFYPQLLLGLRDVYFLSVPLDVAALPVLFRDGNGRQHVRVPREKLLDVIALAHLRPDSDRDTPLCVPMLHQDFDRYEGGFVDIGFESDQAYRAVRSLQRRVLRVASDGRWILQNANTSAVDFVHDLKTPGGLPEP
jgi:hypothetical protein